MKLHGAVIELHKHDGNNEYKISQVPGTTTYTARDLCNNSTASGSSRDEAFRNLQNHKISIGNCLVDGMPLHGVRLDTADKEKMVAPAPRHPAYRAAGCSLQLLIRRAHPDHCG